VRICATILPRYEHRHRDTLQNLGGVGPEQEVSQLSPTESPHEHTICLPTAPRFIYGICRMPGEPGGFPRHAGFCQHLVDVRQVVVVRIVSCVDDTQLSVDRAAVLDGELESA
jgi:hypothetical protein